MNTKPWIPLCTVALLLTGCGERDQITPTDPNVDVTSGSPADPVDQSSTPGGTAGETGTPGQPTATDTATTGDATATPPEAPPPTGD